MGKLKKGRLAEIVKELQGASKMHLKQSKEIESHIEDMGSPAKKIKKIEKYSQDKNNFKEDFNSKGNQSNSDGSSSKTIEGGTDGGNFFSYTMNTDKAGNTSGVYEDGNFNPVLQGQDAIDKYNTLSGSTTPLEKSRKRKLTASCKAAAKNKFDVYPSAYANMWASKQQGKGKC